MNTLELKLSELTDSDEKKWNQFLVQLKLDKHWQKMSLIGFTEMNRAVEHRLETLFFVLFNYSKILFIQMNKAFFNSLPGELKKKYAAHIILTQEQSPRFMSPDEVIGDYNNDNEGVFIRQVTASRFMRDDWLSITTDGPKTRLLSATFVLNDVLIALIGQVPSDCNKAWKYIGGVVFSHRVKCHFAGKSDMSTDLYYLKRIGSYTYTLNQDMLTPDGEIDYAKLYELNHSLKQYTAKVKKNVPELRNKILEQRERIKSSHTTYKTTSGKVKENLEKRSVTEFGVLINNEALLAAQMEDITGVLLNTRSHTSIMDALEIQGFLARQGIHVGLFSYDPKHRPALIALSREEVMETSEFKNANDHYNLSQIDLPTGYIESMGAKTTSYVFYSCYIAQSYKEYFANLNPILDSAGTRLSFNITASDLLAFHREQFETISRLSKLTQDFGWLQTHNRMIPGSTCLKIFSYSDDDQFVQTFIKRFFKHQNYLLLIEKDHFFYQIEVSAAEALKILSKNILQSPAYYMSVMNASEEQILRAQAIQNMLNSIEVPAVIPWESLPFIDVNQQGIFINLAFFYNLHTRMEGNNLLQEYYEYYRAIADRLEKINIPLPLSTSQFYRYPIIDIDDPNAHKKYLESRLSAVRASKPSLIDENLIQEQINTILQAMQKKYACTLHKTDSGEYFLRFSDEVPAEEIYRLQVKLQLNGDVVPPVVDEETCITHSSGMFYLRSIMSFSEHTASLINDLELKKQEYIKQFHKKPGSDSSQSPYLPQEPSPDLITFFATPFKLNQAMINTMRDSKGMVSKKHLQKWQPCEAGEPFTESHAKAILYLINEKKRSPEQAIMQTSYLNESEIDKKFLTDESEFLYGFVDYI